MNNVSKIINLSNLFDFVEPVLTIDNAPDSSGSGISGSGGGGGGGGSGSQIAGIKLNKSSEINSSNPNITYLSTLLLRKILIF